ncbi:CPBP family intramembrane glutamic endopeptidase [Psychroserpens sp. S379A]|uniref:CPBP family intramembrane glutamic endopeptidase n=1 Tax=Psychroserpens sp. S379A TaxID=3415137 RepID=UPI003C7DE062
MNVVNIKTISTVIFAITFVTILPHTGFLNFFPFDYTVPIIAFVWWYLKRDKASFKDIGFSLKDIGIKPLLVGLLSAILIFLFMQFVFFPIIEIFVEFKPVDVELYNSIRSKDVAYFVFILISSWLVGGVYEEIVFHGFIFTRLENIINGRFKTVICFLITALIFALYHLQLGAADTINAFLVGAGYLGLFLFYKRNLWYAIFCHGFYNTIVITSLYLGYI